MQPANGSCKEVIDIHLGITYKVRGWLNIIMTSKRVCSSVKREWIIMKRLRSKVNEVFGIKLQELIRTIE